MRTFRVLVQLSVVLAAVTIGAFLAGKDSETAVAGGNWDAVWDVTISGSTAVNGAGDAAITYNIPGTSMNSGSQITLSAALSCIATMPDYSGPAVICPTGGAPALGDVAGVLTATSILGLANSACNQPINVNFILMMATVDNTDTGPGGPGNHVIIPSNPWEAETLGGILEPFRKDVNTVALNNVDNPPVGSGGDTVGAAGFGSAISADNGIPAHVDLYPSYLNKIFDPDGPGGVAPLQPISRYSSSFVVANTAVILTFNQYTAAQLAAFAPPHPLADVSGAEIGYSSISTLQDTTQPASPTTITDFCAPLTLTANVYAITKINPCAGVVGPPCDTDAAINTPLPGLNTPRARGANPSVAGTHFYGGLQMSYRDTDGDGYENPLDTCMYNANTDNPKNTSGTDADQLDPICDPDDVTPAPNYDGDVAQNGSSAWDNGGDNCPLMANKTNEQEELDDTLSHASRRPRGGPGDDYTGNECDATENAFCNDLLNNDVAGDDALVNDGCPQVAYFAEAGADCADAVDDETENPLTGGDDDDTVNDGCPAAGANGPERDAATCDGATDNDQPIIDQATGPDGLVNDGCPVFGAGAGGGAESVCAAGDAIDNDNDGWVNDGCPVVAVSENGFCTDGLDNDADTVVNDGCPAGPAATGPGLLTEGMLPAHADCADPDDDDGDGAYNDGCPQWGPGEFGCLNAVDEDGDTVVNEGCAPSSRVLNGHYHTIHNLVALCYGGTDIDGDGYCNVATTDPLDDPDDLDGAKTPEHYARHRSLPVAHSGSGSAPGTEPIDSVTNALTSVCFDGIDNDGDTNVDLRQPDGGDALLLWDCAPTGAAQLGTTDADGDGTTDRREVFIGTDALGRCERGGPTVGNVASSDFPDDLSGNTPPNSLDKINVIDISRLSNTFGGTGPTITPAGKTPYIRRVDLEPGPPTFAVGSAAWIGLPDFSAMSGRLPAMYSGAVRSFNRVAVCSAHPLLND